MRRKARGLAQSQGLYTIQNPQREYYRQQYNTITRDYSNDYVQPVANIQKTPQKQNRRLDLEQFGWQTDYSLHPEDFANAGTPINEYQELSEFLPEMLAKSSAAKSKAKKEAKAALPSTASEKQIDELANLIYKNDWQDVLSAINDNKSVQHSNVFKQLQEDIHELDAYRIFTDPIKRAEELGYIDYSKSQKGDYIPGRLNQINQQIDSELKARANKLPEDYYNMWLHAIGDASQFNNSDAAMNRLISGDPIVSEPSEYMLDAFSAFLQGRKEVRIQNFQGKRVRGEEFKNMAKGVQRVLEIKTRLEDIDDVLEQYRIAQQQGQLTPELTKREAEVLEEKQGLETELQQLSNLVDILGSYESRQIAKPEHVLFGRDGNRYGPSLFGIPIDPRRPRDFTQGVQNKLDNLGIGTDIGVHHMLSGYGFLMDKLNDLEKNGGAKDPSTRDQILYTRQQLNKLLDNYRKFISDKQQGWIESAKDEREDLESLKKVLPVPDYFQANVELSQRNMDFGDPKTLMFAMPQQLGSSNASILLSAGSMGLKLIAALAAPEGALGAAVLGGGIVGGAQLDIANAAWENNAETAEGYRRKVENGFHKAGIYQDVLTELRKKIPNSDSMKDEDVLRYLFNGEVELNNIKANEIISNAVFGSNTIYQYDMGETARGAYREAVLQLAPIGALAQATKYIGKSAIYNTANALNKLAGRGEIVVTTNAERLAGEAAQNASKFAKMKANMVAFATQVPRTIMDTKSVGKTIAGFYTRTHLNAIGEGVEEGVQHVRQAEYVNGQYGPSMNMGLFKPIVNDMVLGGRLAYEWLTGNDAGSGYISDQQMFAEMRGGALGALLQSTPVTVMSNIKALQGELRANELVADMFISDKITQRDRIEKAKQYLKAVSSVRYNEMMDKFDEFIRINQNRTNAARTLGTDNVGIDESFIEQARSLYKEAVNWASNKALTSLYEKNGIKKGSKEYYEDLAVVVDQVTRLKETKDAIDKNNLEIDAAKAESVNWANMVRSLDDELGIESTEEQKQNLSQLPQHQSRIAKLLAALEIIKQYSELEEQRERDGKPKIQFTVKKQAETIVKILNKQLNTNINTVDEFVNEFGGMVMDNLKDAHRKGIVLQAEHDVAKSTVSKLLTPFTAVKTVKKLAKQYNKAIEEDEELQQRIQDDYANYMDRRKKIDEYQITDTNNVYFDRHGRKSIVIRENGKFVKYDYDDEFDEPYGQPKEFDKDEYYESREIQDAATPQHIPVPNMIDELDQSSDGEAENKVTPYLDNAYEEDNLARTPISEAQADELLDQFLQQYSDENKLDIARPIKKTKRGITKLILRRKKGKLYGNMAQRISLLHNNGYTFRNVRGQWCAVKGPAKVILKREEVLFGQFLQSLYGSRQIEREEPYTAVVDNTQLTSITPRTAPEPENQGYQPNEFQKQIKETLKRKAQTDKATLVGRNGNNYFFRTDDGKVVMYTRLHAEIGSSKEDNLLSQDKRDEIHSKMKELWSDKAALKQYIESLEQQWNTNLAKMVGDTSTTYDDHKVDLSLYTTPEMLKDQNIISAISELMKGLREDSVEYIGGAWADAGNIVDEMLRRIVGGVSTTYDDIIMIGDRPVVLSEVMSETIFNDFVQQIQDFKTWLDKNKLVPVTDRVLLHAMLKNGHRVSGETDLLAIDEDGNLVIFDFKTSKYDFDETYRQAKAGYKWSTERQHSRQLTGYQNLIDAEFDYRFPVKRRIIVPFVIEYDQTQGVFDKFQSIKKQDLIELAIDNELNKQLNETVDIQEIKTLASNLKTNIEVWGGNIANQFSQLGEYVQNLVVDLKNKLTEATNHVDSLTDQSLPIDIETTMSQLYDLQQLFDDVSTKVDERIQQINEKAGDNNDDGQNQFDQTQGGKLDPMTFSSPEEEAAYYENFEQYPDQQFPETDDSYWDHLATEIPPAPGEKRGKRTFGRDLDDVAADMEQFNQRGGRVSGLLPGETPSGNNVGPEAPITTSEGSKPISDAPDYGNQPPVNFDASVKERGEGGHRFFNVAHRDDVNGKFAEEAGKPDFIQKVRVVLIPEAIEKGLNGLFLSTRATISGITKAIRFYWAELPRTEEDPNDGSLHTVDIAQRVKDKIRQLMEAYPGATLVAKLSRTNGIFKFGETQRNLLDSVLLTDEEDLLTLLDNRTIGVSDETSIQPISRASSSQAIYPFTSGISTVPGIVTWMYNAYYDETGHVHKVPIPLTHKRLQDDDIDLILDILRQKKTNTQLRETYRTIKVGNKKVRSPLSDYDILSLLIRFGEITRTTNTGNNFIFDHVRDGQGGVDRSRVEISGVGQDRGQLYVVDLDNEQDVQKLKARLKNSGFVYANNVNMLMHNLDDKVDSTSRNPFGNVANFFSVDENAKIKSIKISSSLVFDRKDVDFHEDGSNVALNGVGWVVRHGWVTTSFEALTNPRISIEDVEVDDTEKHIIDEESTKPENNKPEERQHNTTLNDQPSHSEIAQNMATLEQIEASFSQGDDYGIPFRVQKGEAKKKIDVEKAKKSIRRMLGKKFPIQIIDGAIKVFEHGKAWAVGACKKDAILLSTSAEAGTEYHETFHRVMELLFSPAMRRRLHNHYIKRYNNGIDLAEDVVGERLAEMFMDFINNLPDVYFTNGVLDGFRRIGQWIKAWRSIDDFTLALMFGYTYSGLARFNSVSKESSENFDRIWGDAAYHTVDIDGTNVTFKEFVNNVHLRDGIRYVTYLILRGYNIDSLGSNLSDLDIRLNTLKTKSWYKIAIGEGAEEKSALQRQLSEIFDHWGSTQKMVNDELRRLSIGGKIDRNDQKDENLQSPTPDIIFTDIDGHMDEFYRYDRKLDLDIALKIFLSTIPHIRYSTRDDLKWETNENGEFVDEKGKVTTDPTKYVRRTRIDENGDIVPLGTVDSLTIPIKNKDGIVVGQRRTTVNVSTNSLGTAEFMDFDTVYSLLVTRLQSAQTVSEMISRLITLGKDDPMFREIALKMYLWNQQSVLRHEDNKEIAVIGDQQLDEDDYEIKMDEYGQKQVVYSRDTGEGKKGHVIKNARILIDVDKESLVTRMFQSFRSQRLKFVFVFANEQVDSQGKKTGKFSYKNNFTNNSHDARIYPRQWFENLRTGLTEIFEVTGSSIKVKKGQETTFATVAAELESLVNNLSSNKSIFSIQYNGRKITLSKRNASDVDLIETYFVSLLNKVGIEIDKPVLDFYINETYPNIEDKIDRLVEMISSRSKTSSFNSFIKMLKEMQSIVDSKNYGRILSDNKASTWNSMPAAGMYLYADNAFVKELGTAYGRYRLATNEFMTLGPENTKMYTMAQNHSASEFTDDFNNAVVDDNGNVTGSQMLPDMMKFVYNYMKTKSGKHIGSIIIKHYLNKHRNNLSLETFIGAKRDDVHDGGTKYTKIAKREDYLSKCTIIENGGLLFPTLSDKSTWFYLTGVVLPGLQYSNGTVIGTMPRFGRGGRIVFNTTDDVGNYGENRVLDQFLEYAECERAAVVKAINELKTLKSKEKSEKNPGRKLELQKQIKNYHTNNQATRFAFLLGIYTEDENDKNYTYKGEKERFISFNFTKHFNTKTREYEDAGLEDCLKVADKYFFNQTVEKRRSLIANILQHRLDDELEWCVDNGILERVENPMNIPYGGYKNKLLNYEKIDILKKQFSGMKNNRNVQFNRIPGVSDGVLESWATVAYLMDVNNKSIMSTEEVMRLYTGIPNFFKWKYGEDGVLTDIHGDMVKRLGGLGSTGDSNRLDLANIPREYTVAEIKDWEIQSEIFDAYKEGFIDNEYRIMLFYQQLEDYSEDLAALSKEDQTERRRKMWAEIQDADIEDIKKKASDRTKRIVEANAAAETKSFAKGINVADGTAYISPQMCLNLLRERGVYTSKVQEAFEYLMDLGTGSDQLSNHTAYKTIFDALISTQKYSAFGYRMEGDIPVHFYNKFALFPLFKSMAYGFTQDLYNQMEKDGVDMVMFDSAVKAGSEGAQNFHPDTFRRSDDESDEQNWNHDAEGNRTEMKPDIRNFEFNVYKQEYKFIRRQLNTDPREDERMHIGTQMLKITLSNLILDAMYKTSRGEIYGNELRDDIMECMRELASRGENKIRTKLFTGDQLDINKLSKFLKAELSTRGADQNTLKQLDVVDGKFRVPLEAMSNIAWIESIIISHINKEIIDINLPGNAFYQRTPFGMEGSPIRIVSDQTLDSIEDKSGLEKMIAKAKKQFQIYSGRSLKAINNDGSMDCIISIDYFMNQTDLIPKEYRNNYWAARNYLKKNGIIGKNAKAIMVGYRIPTQAESSVHALRVVDVLPVVRDTIVLPKDFTKITGSDFDIDKLYLTSYNFKRNDDNTITTDFDESDDRYWQNRLLDDYMTLLKDGGYIDEDGKYHKGRTLQFLHRSIDNDTSLVKNGDGEDLIAVYNRIYGRQTVEPEQPFGYQSLHSQVDIKQQFIGGKFGIGPFALANNAQILTMIYNVSFRSRPGSIINELGMLSLHDRTDKNGNSILAWLSAMINAHVDVAKDPYITALNVNSYTYGLVNMMLRTGMGDQTFMFTSQPIMVEAAKVFDIAGGNLVEDPSKSKTARQENAVREHVIELLQSLGKEYKEMIDTVLSQGRIGDANARVAISKKVADVAKQLFGIQNGKYTNQFYMWDNSTQTASKNPISGRTILEDILVNPEVRIDPTKPASMQNLADIPYYAIQLDGEWEAFTPKEIQLYVIAAMYELKPYVNALEDVVKYTKIDTKKHGSNWSDQKDYQDNFDDLYVSDDEDAEENEFFTKELNDMLDDSFLADKTNKAIDLLDDILKESAIQYTDKFRVVQSIIQDAIKNHTDDAKTKVPRMILGYIKAQFFNEYMKRNDIDPKELFIGTNSIQSRLSRIKYSIKNDVDGKYYEYGTNGVVTNSLFAALESVPYERNARQPMFIKLNKAMVEDPDMINDIIRSWNFMLTDAEHPEMQKFARDLVVYAFLTSADTNGFTKFFKYVPVEWKEQSGYNEYMTGIKNMDAERFITTFGSEDAVYDMIWNNWFDEDIVPTMNYTERRSNNGKKFIGNVVNTKNPIIKKSNIYSIMAATWKHYKSGEWRASLHPDKAPMFIKIRRQNASYGEESQYLLYKLVGTGEKTYGEKSMSYPIYALVRPKGMSVNAVSNYFNIYEYDNDFGFEYVTDDVSYSMEDVDSDTEQVISELQEWLQNNQGSVLDNNNGIRNSSEEPAEKIYRSKQKQTPDAESVELTPEQLQQARETGRKIKDECNNRT